MAVQEHGTEDIGCIAVMRQSLSVVFGMIESSVQRSLSHGGEGVLLVLVPSNELRVSLHWRVGESRTYMYECLHFSLSNWRC